VKKDLKLKFNHARVQLHRGPLHVKGDLEFSRSLVILGDLVVDGVLADGYEHMSLLVTGSVRARGIHCRHRLWSGGRIEAEVIVVKRDAGVHAAEGIHAELVLVTDDEVKLEGVEAKTFIDGETMVMHPEKALAKLRKLLGRECFKDDDDESFDAKPLFARLRAGKPWAL